MGSRQAAAAFLTIAFTVCASAVAGDLVVGTVAGPLACSGDATATYAYYLPNGYTPERKWPILFVFDPRSRGAFAAELFRQAADDYGWIVVSSNNTMSDTDPGPSIRAINAMAFDVPKRFPIDGRRMYAAGFSGGAIYAWALAKSANFAGVIGASGRPMSDRDAVGVKFDWFGTAGTLDFNYSETRAIERSLDGAAIARRTEVFSGPHRWAPPDVLRRGVEWMELQAMRRGTRPRQDALIDRLFREDLARAADEPDALQTERHLDAIVRTFEGLVDVDEIRKNAEALRSSAEVRRLAKEERDADKFEERYRARMSSVFRELPSADHPSAPWLLHALDIPQLQRTARERSYRGTAAARLLQTMYTSLHYYMPSQFRAAGQGELVNLVLAVASQIQPESPPASPPR